MEIWIVVALLAVCQGFIVRSVDDGWKLSHGLGKDTVLDESDDPTWHHEGADIVQPQVYMPTKETVQPEPARSHNIAPKRDLDIYAVLQNEADRQPSNEGQIYSKHKNPTENLSLQTTNSENRVTSEDLNPKRILPEYMEDIKDIYPKSLEFEYREPSNDVYLETIPFEHRPVIEDHNLELTRSDFKTMLNDTEEILLHTEQTTTSHDPKADAGRGQHDLQPNLVGSEHNTSKRHLKSGQVESANRYGEESQGQAMQPEHKSIKEAFDLETRHSEPRTDQQDIYAEKSRIEYGDNKQAFKLRQSRPKDKASMQDIYSETKSINSVSSVLREMQTFTPNEYSYFPMKGRAMYVPGEKRDVRNMEDKLILTRLEKNQEEMHDIEESDRKYDSYLQKAQLGIYRPQTTMHISGLNGNSYMSDTEQSWHSSAKKYKETKDNPSTTEQNFHQNEPDEKQIFNFGENQHTESIHLNRIGSEEDTITPKRPSQERAILPTQSSDSSVERPMVKDRKNDMEQDDAVDEDERENAEREHKTSEQMERHQSTFYPPYQPNMIESGVLSVINNIGLNEETELAKQVLYNFESLEDRPDNIMPSVKGTEINTATDISDTNFQEIYISNRYHPSLHLQKVTNTDTAVQHKSETVPTEGANGQTIVDETGTTYHYTQNVPLVQGATTSAFRNGINGKFSKENEVYTHFARNYQQDTSLWKAIAIPVVRYASTSEAPEVFEDFRDMVLFPGSDYMAEVDKMATFSGDSAPDFSNLDSYPLEDLQTKLPEYKQLARDPSTMATLYTRTVVKEIINKRLQCPTTTLDQMLVKMAKLSLNRVLLKQDRDMERYLVSRLRLSVPGDVVHDIAAISTSTIHETLFKDALDFILSVAFPDVAAAGRFLHKDLITFFARSWDAAHAISGEELRRVISRSISRAEVGCPGKLEFLKRHRFALWSFTHGFRRRETTYISSKVERNLNKMLNDRTIPHTYWQPINAEDMRDITTQIAEYIDRPVRNVEELFKITTDEDTSTLIRIMTEQIRPSDLETVDKIFKGLASHL